ncbi:MAG: glycoside hydrolase family 2 TIM barrel-domain containing protein [Planctomycetota bacterium]
MKWITFLIASFALNVSAQPVPVEVVETDNGWRLLRGGEPYYIHGAGGDDHLELLNDLGGNSIRTWGAEQLEPREWPDGRVMSLPDRAHELGLTICAGFWVQHPSGGYITGGFDYDNEEQVQGQIDEARKFVRKWKDHPAILMWGVGNEATGSDNRRAFIELERIAKVFKQEDPNHPTMTAIPGVWPNHGGLFKELCPSIDILGVNAYGGLPSVPQTLESQGYTGPYVVTEYGPIGHWETAKTDWGAEVEQTSAGKARTYVEFHRAGVSNMPRRALGAYIFLWGQKQERTETWYGMFLKSGEKTATVDAMARIWQDDPKLELDNHAPLVEALETPIAMSYVEGGVVVRAHVDVTDPDRDRLTVRWVVRSESTDKKMGGAYERQPGDVDGVIESASGLTARVRIPEEPGPYRLFAYVYDGKGAAGTANVPFFVKE